MARKKNRVIPIQPSKVLLDYQKIYNNDVIHILRFVPGSKGKDEQFTLKCNCGKEYSAYLSDIEYARINKEYSDIRCDNCVDSNIYYYEDDVVCSSKTEEVEDVIEENEEPKIDWKFNPSHNELIQSFLENYEKRCLTKTQYYQIKFLGIAFIKNYFIKQIDKNFLENIHSRKKTSPIFEIICPGCFKTHRYSYSNILSRISNPDHSPIICEQCNIQQYDDRENIYTALRNNLNNPGNVKKVFVDIPIYSLSSPELKYKIRANSIINRIPNKVLGLSNAIIKSEIYQSRLIDYVCPMCKTEFLDTMVNATDRFKSKTRSNYALCQPCQTIYDHAKNDKNFKKMTEKITKWEPYYKSTTDFNQEFQEYYIWLFTLSSEFINSILLERSYSIDPENENENEFVAIDTEVLSYHKNDEIISIQADNKGTQKQDVFLLLDNLEEKLKTKNRGDCQIMDDIDSKKMDTEVVVQKTFFLQIVNDPKFKELVMEKTATIVSENFASRLIKE